MANGTYGTKRPAFITSDDVDIYYHYRPTRHSDSSSFSNFKKLESSDILFQVKAQDDDDSTAITLPGMYDIRLPLDTFSEVGFYTLYIKPKEIKTEIVDVSTLASFTNIRGIVLNANNVDDEYKSLFNNGNLVGYRIEYFDNSTDRNGDYRIITSNNRCEPLAQNLNTSTQKGIKYSFNDSSNLIFCTVTPSTANSFKPSSLPEIGSVGQTIALVNTKFNPVMMEIEIVEHDIETLSTMVEGTQVRNLSSALITTFNDDDEIYHQSSYGNISGTIDGTSYNHDFKIVNTDANSINYTEKTILDNIKKKL